MISVFGWPDPNTGFDQSEHALYTCYFTNKLPGDMEQFPREEMQSNLSKEGGGGL